MSDDATAFPTLTDADMAVMAELGTRRPIAPGEYLYREGDVTYDFFVVVSGTIEVVTGNGDGEQIVAVHGAGKFLGELNLLTGMRVFVNARVAEAGEVIVVPRDRLRRLIATDPGLSDTILAAFMARRSILLTGASASTRIIGSRYSRNARSCASSWPAAASPTSGWTPTAIPTSRPSWRIPRRPRRAARRHHLGAGLRRPTPGALSEYLGLTLESLPDRCFDLVIVGRRSRRPGRRRLRRLRGARHWASRSSASAARRGRARGSRTTWGSPPGSRAPT